MKNEILENYGIEPPADLLDKVVFRVKREQRMALIKRRLAISAGAGLSALAALVFVGGVFIDDANQSGFLQFFSLIFSDWSILLYSWKEFSFSLLESMPVFSLAALLAITVILISSFKFLIEDAKVFVSRQRLINS